MKFLPIALVLLSGFSFAQKKTLPVFPINSPPKSKTNISAAPSVIKPKNGKTLKKEVGKPASQTKDKGGAFFIKPSATPADHQVSTRSSSTDPVIDYLVSHFSLDQNYSFKKVGEKTDELGFTHISYQQLYKNIPLNEGLILAHLKAGKIKTINGHIQKGVNMEISPRITESESQSLAKKALNTTETLRQYPAELVITKRQENYFLTYKVQVEANSPIRMFHVFVDANTGEVINKISLMAHADTLATVQTLYSGRQSITCDSYSGGYRLRDNQRKIETYDATKAESETDVTGAVDFTSPSTNWGGGALLFSFTIATVSQSWWHYLFDDKPDLYVKIKDGSGQTVYKSETRHDTDPVVTFNLRTFLSNPPYTAEIWDEDVLTDDFGGTYSILVADGTQNWSGNGNSGTYSLLVNPALDAHWGMEKTYDFYLNVFRRNSYDDRGGVIKQYLNLPSNNKKAFALRPYNTMFYGLGDGMEYHPLVSLDVIGHEFTHLVIWNNGIGSLVYQAESGALNESFADIMGTAIEFHTNVDPDWTIGGQVFIKPPGFLRSMSAPKQVKHPDTYMGTHWVNTSDTSTINDHGGVHTNSGVQNYWFYLLCEGGSGTNDLGDSYGVTGIGIVEARRIAYRNLTTYLTKHATYQDAYQGSLQATADIFGNPSRQYTAVQQAWYAVGIGEEPGNCGARRSLTARSGTITDGSGAANYNDETNCEWVITPPGATQITLTFTEFDTEQNYDVVTVYDGPSPESPVLMIWHGNTLPPVVKTTEGVGAMSIVFSSDDSNTGAGWSASYVSKGSPTCSGPTSLMQPSGSFSDGSGNRNYSNNQSCLWWITPPCATSVTLSFSAFSIEQDYDFLLIYDGLTATNRLALLTGSTLPESITSTTGTMLVVFFSDHSNSSQGFSATYTSTGAAQCSGITTINTSDHGTVTDGSGTKQYCNNLDCQWLIQPPQATTVTLDFTEFDLEQAGFEGAIFDFVEVYDGTSAAATSLGKYSGSTLPRAVTSTGGSLFVKFHSDLSEKGDGWKANYTSTNTAYCNGVNVLTAQSSTIADGSTTNDYANNTYCSWLIQPENAISVTLNFTKFATEQNYDGVAVYDGVNNSYPVLGQFSGNEIPTSITSSSGRMFVEFVSNRALRANGWSALYHSTVVTGIEETKISDYLSVYPNPSDGILYIDNLKHETVSIQLINVGGKEVFSSIIRKKGVLKLDLQRLASGIYTLSSTVPNQIASQTRIVIK